MIYCNPNIRTHLFANSVSNYFPFVARLPYERDKAIGELQDIFDSTDEDEMLEYRQNLRSL